MITLGYLVITVMCLIVLAYAIKLWRDQRDAFSLLILIPLMFLWLDNFTIATGRFIGEGNFLTLFNYLRYYWHWQMLPLLIIVAGMLLRRAGFSFAENKLVMSLFCLTAVGFMILDVPYIFEVEFYPACYGETFRLVASVPEWQICDPTNPPPEGLSVSPLPAISVNVALLIVGIAIWVRHGFPWLALGCGFMFVAAGLSQLPGFYYGPLLGNFGEPILNGGLLAAAFKFGRNHEQKRHLSGPL
jgi:hypothetical protein